MKTNTLNKVPRVRNRIGMTLIEILVVISIIAVLAGMLIPVIGAVRRRGQVTATVLEIQNLKNAIEQYKQKFGDYPPDGSNSLVLERHIRIAFPRIHTTEIQYLRNELKIQLDNGNVIPKSTRLDPAEALVFFLSGFSDDPRYPFQGKGGPASVNPNPGLFDFDPNRLLTTDDGDDFAAYYPRGSDVPFVYFDSRTYMPRSIYGVVDNNGNKINAPAAQYPLAVTSSDKGIARPYRSDQERQVTPSGDDQHNFQWVNKNTFQIIAAGITNHYGNDLINCDHGHVIERAPYCPICDHKLPPTPAWTTKRYFFHRYPSGSYYSEGDNSNITSFSRGTLEDDIP